MMTKINSIDYLQKWGANMSSFDVELSFTWLDWSIMDQIIMRDDFDVSSVETEQQLQLCFNIFPQGQGILHKLAVGGVDFGKRVD